MIRSGKHIAALALALAALSACGSSGAATAELGTPAATEAVYDARQATERTDFVVYQDETYPFEMQLPREWYVGEFSTDSYGIVATNTNDASEPRALVAVVAEPLGPDFELEQGFRSFTESFKSQPGLSGFRSEGERSAVVNGLPGREAYFRYTLDNIPFRHRALVVAADENFYGISYAAPESIFASNESVFNSVLPTFMGE